MRRLGSELKVDPMAIYYHIPNKEALLDGIVEAVMSQMGAASDDPSLPLDERLRQAAFAYRAALLAHPGAMPIMASRPLRTPTALQPIEAVLELLRNAGFGPSQALAAVNIVGSFVRGVVLLSQHHPQHLMDGARQPGNACGLEAARQELPPERFPALLEVLSQKSLMSFEEEFDLGIRALIAGLLSASDEEVSG